MSYKVKVKLVVSRGGSVTFTSRSMCSFRTSTFNTISSSHELMIANIHQLSVDFRLLGDLTMR